MVLSNCEIIKAIEDGLISIDPLPPLDKEWFDTTSINLRLGNTLLIPKEKLSLAFDLRKGGIANTLSQVYNPIKIQQAGYNLDPRRFVLGITLEQIGLNIVPDKTCYAARVEGRSSFARCGLLVHFTAPTIHAGFQGRISLELINLGTFPIALYTGMPICQLIFEEVQGKVEFKKSQFHLQASPEGLATTSKKF